MIENVPHIRDVTTLIELVRALGVRVDWPDEHSVAIDATRPHGSRSPTRRWRRRSGPRSSSPRPLLARTGLAVLPRPGGDKIGRRRLDTHLLALRQLGARITLDDAYYRLELAGRFRAPTCSSTRPA